MLCWSSSPAWSGNGRWRCWSWAFRGTWTAPRDPEPSCIAPFAARVEESVGLPVALWDERRTTVDAHRILQQAGKNAKKRKKTVDAVAASLILEGYLDFKRMGGQLPPR